jgi:hypothetical protein
VRSVYIEYSHGKPLNRNMYLAQVGFEDRYYDVIECDTGILMDQEFVHDSEHIIVGSIRTVLYSFKKMGASVPVPIDYPEKLQKHLYRTTSLTTYSDATSNVFQGETFEPFFLKPANNHKRFPGTAISEFKDLIPLAPYQIDKDEICYVSSVLDFLSEWRVYVLQGRILKACHYRGNPTLFPCGSGLDRMLSDYSDAPAAYAIDVGLVHTGKCLPTTVLIEINDAFALGNYGLDPHRYSQMIESRWAELTRNIS